MGQSRIETLKGFGVGPEGTGLGGALLGGAKRGVRNVILTPLARLNQQLSKLPQIFGERPDLGGDAMLEGIERQKEAEAAVSGEVHLPAQLASGLAEFGTEVALVPGASKLLALRAPRAATAGGRIATAATGEAAKFGALEGGLSLIEGEPLEEASRRVTGGVVAGAVLGGAGRGALEGIGGIASKVARLRRQLQKRDVAQSNLAETAELKIQPKAKPPVTMQEFEAELARDLRATEKPPLINRRPEVSVADRERLNLPLQDPSKLGVGSTLAPEAGVVDAPAVGRGVKAFLRRNFTSKGDLPKTVHDRMIQRDGGVGVTERQIAFTLRDFRKAKRKVYGIGRSVPEGDVVMLDRALKGDIPVEQIPEPFRPIITRMRNEVDTMSRRLIDSGAIEGELEATIERNIGSYATRSYRVFDDPDWALKVSQDVRNKAKALIRSEFPNLTEEQVAGQIEALLYRGKEAGSPIGLMGKLGSKDLSILKRRKGIPPEIRALYGEHTDATVNYARSTTKMAHLIENHHFLTDVRSGGLGKFFFETPTVRGADQFKAQIATAGSKTLEPLNGLYTTPEIAKAFEEIGSPQQLPDWLRHYMKVNGFVKFSKTVLSMLTHVRNTTANVGFAVANGLWRVLKSVDALRTIGANTGVTDFISNPRNTTKWRNEFLKLQRLRVVDESARAGELGDVLADAIKGNLSDPGRSLPVRVASVGLKFVKSLYRAEDDVWKVFAFYNERARYGAAKPEWSVDRLEAHVAEIVRNTHPTYSLVPRGVKMLRRFPIVGNFVSFPSEVARTLFHSIRLMSTELADPALRGIGAQRLVGLVTAATGVSAAATGVRHLVGIDKQTDEDLRRSLPPWSENSELIHLGRKPDGTFRVIDLSYTDPYAYLRTPLTAFLRGENWEDKIVDAALEAAEPFIGEEILLGKLNDIRSNKKRATGGPVFNPQDPFLDRMDDILSHVYDALEPGTVTSAKRIQKGLSGTTSVYGRSYDPKLEALAVFTGTRIMEVDVAQSLTFKVGKFTRDQGDAMQILRSVATRRGTVSDDELLQATTSMERARQETFQEMHEDIQAAERLGVSITEIRQMLKGRLSRQQVTDLINGEYRPFRPTGQFLGSLGLDPTERLRRLQLIRGQ